MSKTKSDVQECKMQNDNVEIFEAGQVEFEEERVIMAEIANEKAEYTVIVRISGSSYDMYEEKTVIAGNEREAVEMVKRQYRMAGYMIADGFIKHE